MHLELTIFIGCWILKRMERGRIEASRKGNCICAGKPKFGFDYDRLTKRMAINPKEAEIVKRIFSGYLADGTSTKKLALSLNRENAATKYGGKWDDRRVGRILRDSTYFGEWHYNKRSGKENGKLKPREEWVKVAVPAIIEKETFDQVQKLIESRKNVKYQSEEAKYLLKDLLFCGECGEKACMAFALKLWSSQTALTKCKPVFGGTYAPLKDALVEICGGLGVEKE